MRAVRAGPEGGSEPLVVLEAGAFGFSADWAAVQDKLSAAGIASLAYDRAGLGGSEPGTRPRDSQVIISDLEALLAALKETGPLVLCGHSMAGLHVRLFTARHPERVKGVVLVDATTPEAIESKLLRSFVEPFAGVSKLAAWGAEAGLMQMFAGALGDAIGLEGAAAAEKRWAFAAPGHNQWAAEEASSWAVSSQQGQAAGGFDATLPVAVILAGPSGPSAGLRAMQTAPARASKSGWVEIVKSASHATILSAAHADAVVRGIKYVLDAAANPAG